MISEDCAWSWDWNKSLIFSIWWLLRWLRNFLKFWLRCFRLRPSLVNKAFVQRLLRWRIWLKIQNIARRSLIFLFLLHYVFWKRLNKRLINHLIKWLMVLWYQHLSYWLWFDNKIFSKSFRQPSMTLAAFLSNRWWILILTNFFFNWAGLTLSSTL